MNISCKGKMPAGRWLISMGIAPPRNMVFLLSGDVNGSLGEEERREMTK